VELEPALTRLAVEHLGDGGGLRDGIPLGPLSLRLEAPPAIARFGAVEAQLGLLPVSGLGVSLDAGFLRGAGSASKQGDRYLASFAVDAGPVLVSAFGVLERLPGGGSSIVVLLGARFTPGIQIGFGFQIAGIGGLVGVNRRIDAEEMRRRLTSGQAIDVLFPDDPQKRSAEVLRGLQAFFPPRAGSFVVGPTFTLTWVKIADLDLFTADLALLIELPGPARIVLVGSARAQIGPRETPLLYLRLDVLGIVDFQEQLFSLDAALVDSRAFGIFKLTGGAAVRISWGDRPYAVLTVGGFFPGFNPEPARIPPLDRVGLSLDSPLPGIYLRVEGYFAVTSNTVQFGGRLEAGLSAAGLTAGGFIELDALVRFSPFWFTARFAAGFGVKFKGRTLAGVGAEGTISGPGPFVIHAELSIEILFFEISWSETFTLGSGDGDRGPTLDEAALLDRLAGAIGPTSIEARGGGDRSIVASEPRDLGGRALLVPGGTLVVRQRRVPVGLPLDRVEGVPLARRAEASLDAAGELPEPPRDWFAPGAYVDVATAAQAVNRPHFERMPSGIEVGFAALQEGPASPKPLGYVEEYKPPLVHPALLASLAHSRHLAAMRGRGEPPQVRDRTPLVAVADESWVVHGAGGVPTSATHAHALARDVKGAFAVAAAEGVVAL
jgi:hypothetical protein